MSFAARMVDGTVDSFNWMALPEQHPNTQNYIVQQLSQFSSTLSDIGRSFMEKTRDIYEKLNDSNSVRMAKAALRMAKGVFHPNTIIPLETIDDLRAAQPVMQRYMMASPYIRDLYHQQLCDGYNDTYVDVEPGRIGEQHYDYRRVMDAMIVETEVDGEASWSAKMYLEDLKDGDRALVIEEKAIILKNWDLAEIFHRAGRDATDLFAK